MDGLDVLHVFSLCSGLKLNQKKTEVLWLGSNRNNPVALPGIQLNSKPIKILGIHLFISLTTKLR